MPKQLFAEPHPKSIRLLNAATAANKSSLERSVSHSAPEISQLVRGLRWGPFTGSPELAEPKVCYFFQQYSEIYVRLIPLDTTNTCYAVPRGSNVMQGSEPDTMNLVSWSDPDGVVRVRPLSDQVEVAKVRPLMHSSRLDPITCCGSDPHMQQLWFGHRSGRISVYQCFGAEADRFIKNRFLQHSISFTKLSYNSAFRNVSSKGSYIHL